MITARDRSGPRAVSDREIGLSGGLLALPLDRRFVGAGRGWFLCALLCCVVGPRGLGLGLGRELAVGVVEVADVVALGVVGVGPERLPVLLGDLSALGGLFDRQADPAPLQVDLDDLHPEFLAGA